MEFSRITKRAAAGDHVTYLQVCPSPPLPKFHTTIFFLGRNQHAYNASLFPRERWNYRRCLTTH